MAEERTGFCEARDTFREARDGGSESRLAGSVSILTSTVSRHTFRDSINGKSVSRDGPDPLAAREKGLAPHFDPSSPHKMCLLFRRRGVAARGKLLESRASGQWHGGDRKEGKRAQPKGRSPISAQLPAGQSAPLIFLRRKFPTASTRLFRGLQRVWCPSL